MRLTPRNTAIANKLRKKIQKKTEVISDGEEAAPLMKHVDELRGKSHACWCPEGQPCHGDVTLEIANR